MKKTPHINDIFQKVNSKHYEKNALLKQDILSYFYKVIKEQKLDNKFRFWDLAMWLMKKNLEFFNYYNRSHIKYRDRIDNRKDRIENALRDLMALGLIRIGGTDKAKKVNTDINIYEYTRSGQLVAWLIEGLDHKDRKNAIDEIYNIAVKAFSSQDDSSSITISSFLVKCKEKGLFDQLVEHIQNIIHSDLNPGLRSVVDLFSYTFNSSFDGSSVKSELLGVWSETIQQLDPETRKLMVYQLKLHVEKKFANRQEFVSRQYEELCFKLKGDHEKIALEGDCLCCKYGGNLELHYTEYLKIIASTIMVVLCPRCGTQNLLISNL